MHKYKLMTLLLILLLFNGCMSVRQVDIDSWVGQPIYKLESHPIFVTLPVIKTQTSDGTEIWNYVNGANLSNCMGNGSLYTNNKMDYNSYNYFSNCMQRYAACNNLFYIRDSKVINYTPIGTGGARCYTNEKLQPLYHNSTNIQ